MPTSCWLPVRSRRSSRQYYKENSELVKKKRKEFWEQNKDDCKASVKKYSQTERGKQVRRHSHRLRKARLKSVLYSGWTPEDLENRFAEFGDRCAYCNQLHEAMQADHFIPLASGGSHVIGNIVPACPSCNFSKNERDPYLWFVSTPFFSKKRWKLILKVLGKTEQNYNQIPFL